jgi:serine protease AprX
VLLLTLAIGLPATLFAQPAHLGGNLSSQLASLPTGQTLAVVVTFHGDGPITADQVAAVQALGIHQGVVMQSLPIMGVLATGAQINALANLSGVRSIFPNRQLKYFNHETTALTGVQRLQTDTVMTARNNGLPYLGQGITVEVNDTGIDATHADLQFGTHVVQNVQGATNLNALSSLLPITYVENQLDTDSAGHGTHVAGTVAATGARSNGKYAGAAPGANLVGYGSGAVIFVLDGVGGFDYAVTHQAQYGIRVITNSFGSDDPTFDPEDPLNVASYQAFKRGIVVLFAAGNSGPGVDTLNPYAKAPWVIGVAAANKGGFVSDFSSRGLLGDSTAFTEDDGTSWTLYNQPTIAAPGEYIISTRSTGNNNTLIAGEAGPQVDQELIEPAYLPFYTVFSGTSQATPHVAGVVALILEANPKLGPLDVKSILQQTATNIPGRASWEVGSGMVNAYAAVDRATQAKHAYGATDTNNGRTFNASVLVQQTKTPFTVDYNPVSTLSATANSYTFTVPANTSVLAAGIQTYGVNNDVQYTGNAIDMFLIAPDGTQYESGVPVDFSVVSGRSVVVDSPMAGTWQVYLQALVQVQGTDVSTVPETINGLLYLTSTRGTSGLSDISGSPAQGSILAAVGERLMDGLPHGAFKPNANLTRIDMANYLTMGNEIRQYIPVDGSTLFRDVTGTNLLYASSVATTGSALRDWYFVQNPVMPAASPGHFDPSGTVNRVNLAYSLVQSLGLQSQAQALRGHQVTVTYNAQQIPVDDANQIPAGMEGYVQTALDLNILNAYFSLVQGPYDLQPTIHATFKPSSLVKRADYAVAATRWLINQQQMGEQ